MALHRSVNRNRQVSFATGVLAAAVALGCSTGVSFAQPCPPPLITGTLGQGSPNHPSTSGVQTGRILNNGVSSTCAAPKLCPGIAPGAGSFPFDAYQFANTSVASQCITFSINQSCGANQALQVVAYLGSHDPSNPCMNYLGDLGFSVNGATAGAFSVTVPGNSIVVLVFVQLGTAPGCPNYSFAVTGLPCQGPCLLECPANITVSNDPNVCGATVAFAPTVNGSCTGPVVCAPASPHLFPIGTSTVNCTTQNAQGLPLTCSFTVTVNDTQPPTITCPPDSDIGNDPDQCGAIITYPLPLVSDNCGGVGVPVCVPASGSFVSVFANPNVSCSVTDAHGNSSTCTFRLNVQDTQPPNITCPIVLPVFNTPGQCQAQVTFPLPIVSDNCPNVGVPVCVPASGSNFPVGNTTVNCHVDDASVNSPDTATCSFTVTVIDNEAPVITCPAGPINVLSSTGTCTAVVNFTVTATDNCDPNPTIVCAPASGTVFQMGTTHVTCTATDHALVPNTSAPCGFDVIVTCAKRATGSEKGSLLIFSDVEVKWSPAGAVTQDTFIKLSNDNNIAVDVQMFFINGDPPLDQQPPLPAVATERAHPGWNNVDNQIHLTADQPTYWSVLRGAPGVGGLSPWTVLDPAGIGGPGRPDLDPGAAPGCRYLRGFIIAFAVNSANEQIKWNHLSGTATVVNYALGTAFEYNAWAFQAVNPRIGTGAVVGVPGIIKFDGFEYARGFDQLLMNFQAVGATAFNGPKQVISNTDLTLHLLSTDLRENTIGPRTTKAKFDVWNQNEVKFSNAERCITCWYQALLGTWAPNANHFLRANLQTNVGKARINGEFSPVVCFNTPNNGAHSLLGIISSLLVYDAGVANAETGTNLDGLGYEEGEIRYDVLGGSPPPANPQDENGGAQDDDNNQHGETVRPN